MSGECEKCGEHTLDCKCTKVTMDKFQKVEEIIARYKESRERIRRIIKEYNETEKRLFAIMCNEIRQIKGIDYSDSDSFGGEHSRPLDKETQTQEANPKCNQGYVENIAYGSFEAHCDD